MAHRAPLREDIIAAAARVFRSKGYHGSTMEDIGNELNMLKGSLYYYIQKKEDLLLAIVSRPVEELIRGCREIVGRDLPVEQRLKACIAHHMRIMGDHFMEISVYLQEMFSVPPPDREGELAKIQGWYRDYQDIVIELVTEGMRQGIFRSDLSPRVAVFGLMGMINWTHKWFDPKGRHNMDQIGEIFISIFLEGTEAKTPEPGA